MKSLLSRAGLLLVALLAMAPVLSAQNVPPELIAYPDYILYNGKIATMNDQTLSSDMGRVVQAIAVRGDRIQFIGSDDEVLRYAGPSTHKVDLRGRTVVPGLINTHSHMHDHSLQLWVKNNLDEVEKVMKRFSVGGKSYEEFTKGIELVVKEHMQNPVPGQWAWIDLPRGGTYGTGLGVQYLINKEMTREKLDQMAPNLPVFILAHPKMLMNTAARNAFLGLYEVPATDAAEEAALTQDTTINRSLVVDQYFRDHLDELADIIQDGLKHQSALGFTTFSSHIVGLRIHDAYLKLVRSGRMPIRFGWADRMCQQVEPDMAGCFIRKGDIAGLGDPYFWNVGVTLGGIDAGPPQICTTMEAPKEYKMQERCVLEPGNDYAEATKAALLSHLRFVVNHDYGDKTMDYVMDIMERLPEEDPALNLDYIRSLRISSDHCGFYPRAAQIPRMVKLNMIISCAARMVDRSAPWLKIYGLRNAQRIVPVKSMISSGLMTTAEGEFMVETGTGPTIFAQYMPMLDRKTYSGQVIAPDEAIDRVTLLKMATVWASHYVLRQKDLGTLEPGKYADLVVFNKDYFTIPQAELGSVYPVMTMLGGKPVVVRQEYAAESGLPAAGVQMKFQFKVNPRVRDDEGGGTRLGGD